MAILAGGTFRYVAVVPKGIVATLPWPVKVWGTGDGGDKPRRWLTGISPVLHISNGGPTPNPSSSIPAVLRTRFTLTASGRENASVSAASFCVDSDLIAAFQPGDTLYMARTGRAGLGLSLLRDNRLILAIGCIASLPLGSEIRGGIPFDLADEAKAVFRTHDPEFEFRELPVQVSLGQQTHIVFRGRQQLGNYDIWVEHGLRPGMPGRDECVAISLRGACGPVAASASAQLLDNGELELVRW